MGVTHVMKLESNREPWCLQLNVFFPTEPSHSPFHLFFIHFIYTYSYVVMFNFVKYIYCISAIFFKMWKRFCKTYQNIRSLPFWCSCIHRQAHCKLFWSFSSWFEARSNILLRYIYENMVTNTIRKRKTIEFNLKH